ncbi:MAG: DUF1345 domain-containing protein [Candidatus Eremiobacteraeota bacterium]|nr:DUF1345 domain-containing protein [Candidatus Eremiobacteraeota bacterium]
MFLSAAAAFVLAWFLIPNTWHATIRFVTAFDVAGALLLVLMVTLGMHADAALTRRRAALDDPGRNVIMLIVILCGVVGFAAAITVLGTELPKVHGVARYTDVIIGIAAVVIGWALIHTNFLFRYAYLYYYDEDGDGNPSGIDFPGNAAPNDFDFAYFSFVIGMTFQVSDVQITETRIRRQALVHSLISFAYSAGIIALGVNIASGLLH